MSQIEFSEFSKWKNTLVGHRGVEYQQYIEFLKDNLLSVVNNVFPDFSSKIKSYNISTPLTYRDYTGVDDGGMYGTIKDYKNPYGSILNTTTLIKNLILTGQSVNLHGILGVALTSLLSCGSFVNVNELIREINEKEKEK